MSTLATISPTTPYGPLIESRVRVVTWNLWWRLGDWKDRAGAIAQTLEQLRPDLVCLPRGRISRPGTPEQQAQAERRLRALDAQPQFHLRRRMCKSLHGLTAPPGVLQGTPL